MNRRSGCAAAAGPMSRGLPVSINPLIPLCAQIDPRPADARELLDAIQEPPAQPVVVEHPARLLPPLAGHVLTPGHLRPVRARVDVRHAERVHLPRHRAALVDPPAHQLEVVGTRRIDDRVVEQPLTSSELVEQASRRRQLLVVQLPMLLDPGRRAEHRDRGLGLDEDAPQVLAEAVRLVPSSPLHQDGIA